MTSTTSLCVSLPAVWWAVLFFPAACGSAIQSEVPRVRTGADVLVHDSLHLVKGKRVGVICNRASILADGRHVLDAFRESSVEVVAVFAPEHGFDARAEAGALIPDTSSSGVRVYSLYGPRKKPDPRTLAEMDLLVYDLQDIGVRYYTYCSTLALCMEASAETGTPFLVLDRPNPITGTAVEGPLPAGKGQGFVGMLPLPARHGMTVAEIARMICGEGWIRNGRSLELTVIPMQGWRRDMWFEETGLPWVPPSPNITSVDAALAYAGTCLLEGASVSEGRGTGEPFLCFGAPFLDAETTASCLNARSLGGVRFEPVVFTPSPSAPPGTKFAGRTCHGARLVITDRDMFKPVQTGACILECLWTLAGERLEPTGYIDTLIGQAGFRDAIVGHPDIEALASFVGAALTPFMERRSRYLIESYGTAGMER
ncbi:MAG: DUF1343 domain-containing protein [Bacteroidota bacterium]|nr:DUF1343 domain-containing protein [Bacteroidota bacterium]